MLYRARLWPIGPVAKICSSRKTRGTQFDSGRREFNSPFYQIQVGVKLLLDFRYVGESDGVKNKKHLRIPNSDLRNIGSCNGNARNSRIDKNRVEITT